MRAPVFGSTLRVTVPFPAPGPPLVITIHVAPDVADHVQLAPAVTSTLDAPPPDATDVPGADSAYSHDAGAGCDTVTVLPAIVTVPIRSALPVFAATVSETLPVPVPDAPLAIVIQLALEAADQSHVSVAVTATDTEPPSEATAAVAGETVGLQVVVRPGVLRQNRQVVFTRARRGDEVGGGAQDDLIDDDAVLACLEAKPVDAGRGEIDGLAGHAPAVIRPPPLVRSAVRSALPE